MPYVVINLMEGASTERKELLHKEVSAAVQKVLNVPADWVKVQLVEMEPINHSIGGVTLDKLEN